MKRIQRYFSAFLAALVLSLNLLFPVFSYNDFGQLDVVEDYMSDTIVSNQSTVIWYNSGSYYFFQVFVYSGATRLDFNTSTREFYSDGLDITSRVFRFKGQELSISRTVEYGFVLYTDMTSPYQFETLRSDVPLYIDKDWSFGEPPYDSPVTVDISFSSELTFSYYLNDNAVLPSLGEYLYIEFYDRAPAIPKFFWKPYKYVNYISGTTSVDDYIKVFSPSPKEYNFSYETFEVAGFEADHPYEARVYIMPNYANVIGPVKPVEIAYFEFKLSEGGFIDPNPPKIIPDPNSGDPTDPNDIVYDFNSNLDLDYSDPDIDVPDYDMSVDLSNELLSGAGIVRTLFDKMIDSAGLYSYVTAVLAIAVAGWFVFGSRR